MNNRRVSAAGGVKVWVRIPLGLKNTQTRINFADFAPARGFVPGSPGWEIEVRTF